MADKGRWSIVNPAGEEVTFLSREELVQAVLDDDIEPHAESIPPDQPTAESVPKQPHAESSPPARTSRPTPAPNRLTPQSTDPSVTVLAEGDAIPPAAITTPRISGYESDSVPPAVTTSPRISGYEGAESAGRAGGDAEGAARSSFNEVPIGERVTADELEAAPSSRGEGDEPTQQFTRGLVVPPAPSPPSSPPSASRQSPPEDEGSPLSLSEVGGTFAPPSEDLAAKDEPRRLPAVAGESTDDEETVRNVDVEAALHDRPLRDDGEPGERPRDEGAPGERPRETPLPMKRGTPPPPLPLDRRPSKSSLVPPLPSRTSNAPAARISNVPVRDSNVPVRTSNVPQRSSVISATRVELPNSAVVITERGDRRTPTPRPSKAPERARITAPSLPPPDIIPDALTDANRETSPPTAGRTPVTATATTPPARKATWIIPAALIGIAAAIWLGLRLNRSSQESAHTTAQPQLETPTSTPPPPTEPAATPSPPASEAPANAASASAAPANEPASPENTAPAASNAAPSAPAEPATASSPSPTSQPAVETPAKPQAAAADKPHPNPTPPAVTTTPAATAPAANEPSGPALRRAAAVMRNGDYGTARQLYQTLLQKEPKNPEVLSGLGDTSRALGDKAGARSYYVRALDASSTFLPALLGLADTEWDLGDRVSAQKHYQQLVEHQPTAPERARQRAKGLGAP